ncbi:cupredoxin family copper-binding protein [Streptomyces sp. NPDC006208]|uniref:cupredoxin domain-containing protein n=1 Tax=Streptomyces sp. NPDC006208 TaxID=3156734 RepID=UPI0033B5351B
MNLSRPRTFVCLLTALVLSLFVPTAPEARAASRTVTMSNYSYGPSTLIIDAGSTVTWVNRDTAPHDVKTTSAPVAVHSPMLDKGGTWSFTFTTPGTYSYYCTVHPDMTARIIVKAPPAAPAPPPPHSHAHPQPPARQPMSSTPRNKASTSAPAQHHSAGSPAGASSSRATAPTTTLTPAVPAPGPAQAASAPAGASRPVQPLLLLAGVVSAVAVMCLLLVGSRAQHRGGDGDVA